LKDNETQYRWIEGWSGIYGRKTPLADEKYHRLKADLHTRIGVPVYKLGDALDIEDLANSLIDFF
jgi:hypothetical protein